jgi:ABC-type uncharacterized transport system permease subunit
MSRLIYFLQKQGVWSFVAYISIGFFVTIILTVLGLICIEYEILGGYAAMILLWQHSLLWYLTSSGFVERYENGIPVYAGMPYMIVLFISILIGFLIYTFLSIVIHYIWSAKSYDVD